MRYLVPCIEQLDRAASELREQTAVSCRLALILTDNIVELTFHQKCRRVFDHKGGPYSDAAAGGRYSRLARHRVLGRHFDEKSKFLLGEREISQEEYEFVRICHVIRGEAYHVGLIRDEVMLPLAWEYHQLACDLFGRLPPTGVSWRSGEQHSARVSAYLPNGFHGLVSNLGSVVEKLHAARPPLEKSLQQALAEILLFRVEEACRLLDYLEEANPFDHDKTECLRDCQYWQDLFAEIPPGIEEGTDQYDDYVRRKASEMKASWKPKFADLPVASWRTRIAKIGEANRSSALQGYERLEAEIAPIFDAIESSAGALDQYIDQQIDEMRARAAERAHETKQ